MRELLIFKIKENFIDGLDDIGGGFLKYCYPSESFQKYYKIMSEYTVSIAINTEKFYQKEISRYIYRKNKKEIINRFAELYIELLNEQSNEVIIREFEGQMCQKFN